MLNKEQNVAACDATGFYSSNAVWPIKNKCTKPCLNQ